MPPTFAQHCCIQDKQYPPAAPLSVAEWAARFARPRVFTNGCFDLLHRGHVDYLEKAAALGGSLLVAVNSDHSVRQQNKAPARPINNQADRAALLAALASVDGVLVFEQPTPLELIMTIKPEILVKGGDWHLSDIVGAAEVQQWGGQVHRIAFAYQRSTTDLIKRIRSY